MQKPPSQRLTLIFGMLLTLAGLTSCAAPPRNPYPNIKTSQSAELTCGNTERKGDFFKNQKRAMVSVGKVDGLPTMIPREKHYLSPGKHRVKLSIGGAASVAPEVEIEIKARGRYEFRAKLLTGSSYLLQLIDLDRQAVSQEFRVPCGMDQEVFVVIPISV